LSTAPSLIAKRRGTSSVTRLIRAVPLSAHHVGSAAGLLEKLLFRAPTAALCKVRTRLDNFSPMR
jgi:hypothetical protein